MLAHSKCNVNRYPEPKLATGLGKQKLFFNPDADVWKQPGRFGGTQIKNNADYYFADMHLEAGDASAQGTSGESTAKDLKDKIASMKIIKQSSGPFV